MNMDKLIKERCDSILEAIVGKELVDQWWQSPNKAFDGLAPVCQFEKDSLIVYKYLLSHVQY